MKCEICGTEIFINHFKLHLRKIHDMESHEYYVKYIDTTFHKCKNPICNNEAKFVNLTKGFRSYCSQSCANEISTTIRHETEGCFGKEKGKSTKLERYGHTCNLQAEDGIKKKTNTWLEKYGVAHPMKNNECVNKAKITRFDKNNNQYFSSESLQKMKETNIERYNVENVFQNEMIKEKCKNTKLERYMDFNYNNNTQAMDTQRKRYGGVGNESKILLEKQQNTCVQRYGAKTYNESSDFILNKDKIQAKIIENNRSKYGVDYPIQNETIRQKIFETYKSNFENRLKTYDNTIISYNDGFITAKCKDCNSIYMISKQMYNIRAKNNVIICNICNPYHKQYSTTEKELYNFIYANCNDEVIENERTVLNGKELDIYIPMKKIAFEFDGLYWHNELNKDKNYHLNKTNLCESNGIQLIHIFEDEWLYKQEIVKSRIKSLLGINDRIFARKCIVKEINYKEAEQFLTNNHIQGNCVSKYRYGLYYNDELVSLMTFGQSRFKETEYEMLRFCNRLNTNVIGGASKLFNYFIKKHKDINHIITFADRRWSIGNLYEKLNFKKIGSSKPAYYYIINNMRYNRLKYQKHNLVKEGFDNEKTEHEIMLERGIHRIYDCGNIKYDWSRDLL